MKLDLTWTPHHRWSFSLEHTGAFVMMEFLSTSFKVNQMNFRQMPVCPRVGDEDPVESHHEDKEAPKSTQADCITIQERVLPLNIQGRADIR